MTPWDWVKAVGVLTANIAFCVAFAVYEALAGVWWLVAIYVVITAWSVRLWPRSLRSYRRVLAAERAMGRNRARFIIEATKRGLPPEVILQLDRMIQAGAPAEDVRAVIEEHTHRST